MKVWPNKRLPPSLATLFFRYYLSALLALILIISVVGVIIDQLYNGVDEENGRNFMRGTVVLIQNQLVQQPEARWPAVLASMAPSFSYPLVLTDLAHLPQVTELDEGERQDITRGLVHLDMDGQVIYSRIGHTQRVLAIGPLNFSSNDGDSLLTDGTHARVLWWTLTGLGFGLLVFLAIRPLWDDLSAIRATAERLAAGELSARAPRARSWLLSPLSQGLNSMADRLENQMSAHQALSHAVAHELRTPLARLRFGLSMLDETDSQDEHSKYRHGMERDMQELDELVNASMSYAQLDQGGVVLQWEHAEQREWFSNLVELIRPLAPSGVVLTTDCVEGDVEFDHKLMYIAVRNLLVNAVRYARSQVLLSVVQQDGWLVITVDDDGPGVPPTERERIFDPFHRLDASRDRHTGGFGLGLSFVRLIAKHHGGSISVRSNQQGGARFILSIPMHEDQPDT
jgi:signal transduction histidine kinase